MSILFTYLYPILFSAVFGYYNGWQWIDELDGVYDPRKAKKRWKAASVILRSLALAGILLFSMVPVACDHLPLAACISLPVFDMSINLTAGKGLFYLGTTSDTDLWGWVKWAGYALAITASALILIL